MEWYEVFVAFDFPEFAPGSGTSRISTRLGEIDSWLTEQDPDIDYERDLYSGTGIAFRFNDPNIATLFKLTWVGR